MKKIELTCGISTCSINMADKAQFALETQSLDENGEVIGEFIDSTNKY